MLICDEGHLIKNPCTRAARCLKPTKAPLRVVVTATPIMHTREDLIGLLQFCYSADIDAEIIAMEEEDGTAIYEERGVELYEAINDLNPHNRCRYYALNPKK
jgi:SNF2 family DNA or RNA helicase